WKVGAAWSWLEARDILQSVLNFVDLSSRAAGNFRYAPFAERFHVITNHAVFQSVLLPGSFELNHEALTKISRGHTRRIERLDDSQNFYDRFRADPGRESKLVNSRFEIAILIDVSDEHLGHRPLFFR